MVGAVQKGHDGVRADAHAHGSRSDERQRPRADGDVRVVVHGVLRGGEIGHQRLDELAFVPRPARHVVVLELAQRRVGEEEGVREGLRAGHHAAVRLPEGAAVAGDRVDDRAREDELPPFPRVRRRRGRAGAHPRPGAVARQRERVALLHPQGQLLRHRSDDVAALDGLGREQALAVRRLAHRRLGQSRIVTRGEVGDPLLERRRHGSLRRAIRRWIYRTLRQKK